MLDTAGLSESYMALPIIHKRFDSHMHTPLCGHAYGDPIEYVDAAVDSGISLITFTCHIPMTDDRFAQEGIRMSHDDVATYKAIVEEACQYGKSVGVEVLLGIEAEIHPDQEAMQDMKNFLDTQSFDFVLGSLHHQLPAFRIWLKNNSFSSDEEIVAAYFHCLGEGAVSGLYHSLSHPDVIRVYGTLMRSFNPTDHQPAITQCLDKVADSGICMEINTSGLIKGDFVVHPDPLIMDWAIEREIPFTIGSDSHAPNMVGQFFEPVIAELKTKGLSKLHYFKNGERIPVQL